MQYTFGQVCRRLAGYDHAYGVECVGDAVNNAVQALAGMSGWECLRKVLRFFSATPEFALPQGCAGLVRACVNGRPSSLRGPDFRFVQSGPGDMKHVPFGFRRVPAANIYDLGTKPVMCEPRGRFRLCAFSDGPDEPYLTVKGLDPVGRIVTSRLPMNQYATYDRDNPDVRISGEEPETAPVSHQEFASIMEVVLDKDATRYVTMYARDDRATYAVARYHPSVLAPSFRHYRVSDMPPDKPIELLVETRIDPLPLIEDTDVMPFSCVEPIEYMIMYNWKMQSSEVDAAKKYKDEAAGWLKAQEVVNDTVQTELVINAPMLGTMGAVTLDCANI